MSFSVFFLKIFIIVCFFCKMKCTQIVNSHGWKIFAEGRELV